MARYAFVVGIDRAEALPIGGFVSPGTGIQENFADKARKLGIPIYRLGTGSA